MSLSQAALAVKSSGSLSVNLIGKELALARRLMPKHAIKQVDRLLSIRMNINALLRRWVHHIVSERKYITAAIDWIDFDADKQSNLMLSLVTNQGRATPLY